MKDIKKIREFINESEWHNLNYNPNEEDFDDEQENQPINVPHKDMFLRALHTLFFSWGGDTPPEVFWGCNELLDWYEAAFNINLGVRFEEEEDNFNEVEDAIENN